MARYSHLDPRYNGLSIGEAIRQSTRDNLLYEQTEALKNMNNITNNSNRVMGAFVESSSFNFWALWFGIFVFGGIAVIISHIADRDFDLNLGNTPLYIYVGILIGMLILKMLGNILSKSCSIIHNINVEKERPELEEELKTIQKETNILELDIKYRKSKLQNLEYNINLDNTQNILNEMKKLQKEIDEFEEEYYKKLNRASYIRSILLK